MPGKDARRRSRGGEEEETESQLELVVDAMGVASALVSYLARFEFLNG